ncbi:hypothetical protein VHUM_02010 [Vanrija humicola]|uniref:Protein kinase domain-containing protein n=1 Tax=Vanrija humicola TaxID=5417 RepID=A0A7D8Z4K2_VANHU|nr:hypothetical protein VHUM_02010 [Vanrija humicola]
MSDRTPRASTTPSLHHPFAASSSSASPSPSPSPSRSGPFGMIKSSISRKKPANLDISRSIPKPSARGAAVVGPDSAGNPDCTGVTYIPEADRLRDEIARLQLSTPSSSSSYASGPESPPGLSPSAGTGSAAVAAGPPPPRPPRRQQASSQHSGADASSTLSHSASVSTLESTPSRKHKDKHAGNGSKRKKDKNGEDLVKDEDLQILADLGSGNGGTVTKVWNKKRKCIMARKLILVDAKPSVRKQILRELQIMNDCNSPFIVSYYGCFPVDVHVGIVMEFMDIGSLDYIYRHTGPVPIDIVGKVAEAVLRGLVYLYDVHRIIHRDIKPSNILANTAGEIKICDFGVSGELINSIANTFVGTSTYMSPERIQGDDYTIKSDVWSLGISLVELAHGRFPFAEPPDGSGDEGDVYADDDGTPVKDKFDPDATLPASAQRPDLSAKRRNRRRGVSLGGGGTTMSILDLLQHIVNEAAPRLVDRNQRFPAAAVEFVDSCLDKAPQRRKSPQELLETDWIKNSTVTTDDLKAWAQGVANQTKTTE